MQIEHENKRENDNFHCNFVKQYERSFRWVV